MASDSIKKTIGVALGVCLVCSVLVSTAAVYLKPRQDDNQRIEKIKNILQAGDLLEEGKGVEEIYHERIKPVIVELESGRLLKESEYTPILNPESFDIKTVVKYTDLRRNIPSDKDIGKIKIQPKYIVVYNIVENDSVTGYILPVYGQGLWSTMYGFIALTKDLKEARGFTFYEHGETPGLGGEVDNPNWKKQWVGKKIFGDNWDIKIQVLKGLVDPSKPEAVHQIDGLSGSTLTTRGIDNLIKFWLGDEGYGPYFKKLREDI